MGTRRPNWTCVCSQDSTSLPTAARCPIYGRAKADGVSKDVHGLPAKSPIYVGRVNTIVVEEPVRLVRSVGSVNRGTHTAQPTLLSPRKRMAPYFRKTTRSPSLSQKSSPPSPPTAGKTSQRDIERERQSHASRPLLPTPTLRCPVAQQPHASHTLRLRLHLRCCRPSPSE